MLNTNFFILSLTESLPKKSFAMKRIFFRTKFRLFLAGLLIGLVPSCDYSYFEMDQLPDYTYQPVFALPLVHSTITISDLIPEDDDDLIEVGENKLISLVYSDQLVSASGATFFQLPHKQYQASFQASPSGRDKVRSTTLTFGYDTGYDDLIDSIVFREGILGVEVFAPGLAADGYQASVTLTVQDSYNANGQPFSMTIEAGTSNQVNLADFTFLFYSSGSDHNLFDVSYDVTFSGSGSPSNAPYTFELNQNFQDMMLKKMVGFLDPRPLNLGGMGVNIGLFDSDFEGELYFEDPRIRLRAWNSFGLDIAVQTNDLFLRKDENEYPLTGIPNPWIILGPDINQIGQTAYSEFILNRDNSNIVGGVELYPTTLYSSFSAQLNPSQEKVFVLEQSRLDVHVELELPLNGTATGFSFKDTLALSRNDSIEEVEWIELAVDVVNGMPVELFLQVEFADSLNQVQGVLFEGVEDFNLIESASVDAQGHVIAPERTYTRILLDEEQTQAFLNSASLILAARVSSANQGEQVVRIYDDQTLDVKIGARIKGKVIVEF